jgi:hypothetical protein
MAPELIGGKCSCAIGVALSERDLDRTIGESIDEALAGLRRELEERLDAYRGTLEENLTAALAEAAAESPEEENTTSEFLASLRAIESGSSQSAILQALLTRAGEHAGRLAFLLTPDGEYLLWDTNGFEPPSWSPADEKFSAPADGPWHDALAGRGHIELTDTACAFLCDRLGSQTPAEGVLIPFILQGRLAAVLYADRASDGTLDIAGLSILNWAAARAIETLPFRERPAVAMLRPATEATADEPAMPLWAPPVETEAEAAEETAVEVEAELETETLREPEVEAEAEVETEVAVAEPEPAEAAAEAEAQAEVEASTESGIAVAEPEAPVEVDSEAETAAFEPEVAEPSESIETATVEAVEPEETLAAEAEPDTTTVREDEEVSRPDEDTEPMRPAWTATSGVVETEEEQPTEPPMEEPAAEVTEPPPVETAVPEHESAAADQGPEVSASAAPSSEFEVMPPSDISGPGWAFATNAGDEDEEAFHAEAKRLARLLVSEIKLYHEVDVWEGRRKGNVYGELQDEIDRSRHLFDERVDEEIRSKRDYFYEELVRQLADGNADVLGI